jgi:hypothetical protein
MYDLSREQRAERSQSIPDLVHNISHDNPVVHDLCHRFIAGHIATKEELLCQCIVHLATNWEQMKKEYIDYRLMTASFTPPK